MHPRRPPPLPGAALLALLCWAPAAVAEPLTLEEAVRLALSRNERAAIAGAQSDAAAARLARARAFFFPDLSLSATYTRRANEVTRDVGGAQVVLQSQNALSGNATLSLTLFDARSIPLYRAAASDAEAARHDARNATRLLGFEAADAFFQTLALEQVQRAAQRRLELSGQSLEEAQARFTAQLVSSNDVTKAELDRATAERQLTQARNDVARARLQLGYLLDIEPPAELVDPAEPVRAEGEPGELVGRAQQQRPDLLALDARTRSARFLAQEPLMRLLPSLSLTGQVRATNEAGFVGRTFDGHAAVTLNWTLFDGGDRYAERDERRALARVAELNARSAQRQAAVQVKTALVDLQSADATVKHADVAFAAALKNAKEVGELYRQGLASALDAQSARVALFEAEVALARAKFSRALAALDLTAALGLDPLGRGEEKR